MTLWTTNKLFDYSLLCSIQKLHLFQAPHVPICMFYFAPYAQCIIVETEQVTLNQKKKKVC